MLTWLTMIDSPYYKPKIKKMQYHKPNGLILKTQGEIMQGFSVINP